MKLNGVSQTVSDFGNPLVISLISLEPDSKYDIYCYSEDNAGHSMTYEETIKSKVSAKNDFFYNNFEF